MKITIDESSAEIPIQILNQLPHLFKMYGVPELDEIVIFARPWYNKIMEIVTLHDKNVKAHHEFSFDSDGNICFITINFT